MAALPMKVFAAMSAENFSPQNILRIWHFGTGRAFACLFFQDCLNFLEQFTAYQGFVRSPDSDPFLWVGTDLPVSAR